MNVQELRDRDDSSLKGELSELRKELFRLRMQQGTGQLGKPSEPRRVRRDIARIVTIMRERALAGKNQ